MDEPKSLYVACFAVATTLGMLLLLKLVQRFLYPHAVSHDLTHGNSARKLKRVGQVVAVFPKTIAFIESLPFREIGRANVMGLEAHDHGTVHRDGEPDEQVAPDQFITICPLKNKRLFVWDEVAKQKTPITPRAYWFNDFDYHGVDADPFFRYSLRIDGVFEADFLARLHTR